MGDDFFHELVITQTVNSFYYFFLLKDNVENRINIKARNDFENKVFLLLEDQQAIRDTRQC